MPLIRHKVRYGHTPIVVTLVSTETVSYTPSESVNETSSEREHMDVDPALPFESPEIA